MARKPPFHRTADRSEGGDQKADKEELNRIPAPSVRADHAKDPVAYGNWRGKEPESEEQMQEWLEHERALILRFLGHWKAKAENDKTRAQKEAHEATLMTEWAKWEPETDVETGEIYNDDRRKTMLQSMISVYKNSIKNFADGNSSHNQYTKAQELWEDFLYYQNEWNRPRSLDGGDARGPRTAYHPQMRSKNRINAEKHSAEVMKVVYWRENMIRLYSRWGIGDRSRLPEGGIGPEQLHMYPDNIKHTANGKQRRRVLNEKFPISNIRLNHEAIERKREEVEQQRKKREKSERASLDWTRYAAIKRLPEDHELYHAATEHSTPWRYRGRRIHTSWESNDRLAVASKTRIDSKRIECKRPRYKRLVVPRRVREQTTLLDGNNERQQNDDNGDWPQGLVEHIVWDEIWELDEYEQRTVRPGPHYVYEKPTFIPEGTVKEVNPRNRMYTARKETYETLVKPFASGSDNEMSEAEEGEYQDDIVPLPDLSDNAGGKEGHSTEPPDNTDEESDDEDDLFTKSYLGLPINASDGPDPSNPSDEDDPPGSGPSPGPGGGSLCGKDNGNDSNDEDEQSDDEDSPKPNGSGKRRRFATIPGEVFVEGHDEDGECRWVTCTRTYSEAIRITQRDRVPAVNLEAPKKPNSKGKPWLEVLPNGAHIPVPRHDRYKGLVWKLGKDGLFHRLDLNWRPCIALRKFRHDTGEYSGCSDLGDLLGTVIEENFSHDIIEKWNKRVRQYVNRNDLKVKDKIPKRPRWTLEEITEAVRFLDGIVHKNGLIYLVDNWEAVLEEARVTLDMYRTTTMQQEARGEESIRTKFNRGAGLNKKLADTRQRKDRIFDAELRPKNFFTIEDFEPTATEKKSNTTKRKKRTATVRTTGSAETQASGQESEEDVEDAPEEEAVSDHEGDDEEPGRDPPCATREPPRKRRKR